MNWVTVNVVDNASGKSIGRLDVPTVPRKGEKIIVDGKKYWVEDVVYHTRKNSRYADMLMIDGGVDVIVDTAGTVVKQKSSKATVRMVAAQTNKSCEEAKAALEECGGDRNKAILFLEGKK